MTTGNLVTYWRYRHPTLGREVFQRQEIAAGQKPTVPVEGAQQITQADYEREVAAARQVADAEIAAADAQLAAQEEATVAARESAITKLAKLGLSAQEAYALAGVPFPGSTDEGGQQ